MKCRVCGVKIIEEENAVHCLTCKSVFHKRCITEHLYRHKECPVCAGEMTLLRVGWGMPRKSAAKRRIPAEIRKPSWSKLKIESDVPFFEKESPPSKPAAPKRRHVFVEIPSSERPLGGGTYERIGVLTRFRQQKRGLLGVSMLVTALLIGIFAPYLIHHDPVTYLVEDDAYVNHPPTWGFPLGTDFLGRDVYSQIIWGFRSALIISLPSAAIIGILGTVVGLVSGYYGGIVDALLQRICITFLILPSIPFVALIIHSWGAYQIHIALILGVAICLWPTAARSIRVEVKSIKNRTFIEAARVSGATSRRIIFSHILPNVQHLTFLYMTIGVAFALSLEATVSFLGLADLSFFTWGQMLSFTFAATARTMTWWTILPPGLAIAYMVLSAFFISEGVREAVGKSSFRF